MVMIHPLTMDGTSIQILLLGIAIVVTKAHVWNVMHLVSNQIACS